MYRSVFNNLIGSICSPHLRSVSINLKSLVGEVEHFPWSTMNDLAKVSPCMLQRVEIGLKLLVGVSPTLNITFPLPSGRYEGYFHQVCSALPELDKRVIISITVRHSSHLFAISTSSCSGLSMQDIFDAAVRNRTIGIPLMNDSDDDDDTTDGYMYNDGDIWGW